jgi:4-amino-4-deoxy-L-arabinose transferase-like glycosyltransferase
MAARGRLWMPHHELGDHFDTFHLITDGVYAVKYGPGTAMLCAPAVWLGIPPGMICLLLTGASVALLYLVLCQTVDGLAGVLGAVMLPAISSVRRVSIEVLSQAPMLFLMLLAVWAVLHWRRTRGRGWLAIAWVAAGWGMITRPVDGAGLVVALGLGMTATWWASREQTTAVEGSGTSLPRRRRLAWEIVIPVLAVLPFVVIQLVFDKGITGRWFTLPWAYLAARNDPYDTVSVAATPPGVPHEPVSVVPRVRAFSEAVSKPAYEAKIALGPFGRLRERAVLPTLRNGLPSPLLLVLLPASLMGLWRRGRWVLAAVLPVYLLVYARYTYIVTHYVVTVTPALIVMVLVGWDAVAGLWGRLGATAVRVAGGCAIAAVAVSALPQMWPGAPVDEWDIAGVMRLIDERIGETVRPPAVVLFRAEPGVVSFHIEPTYNTDVAWPDDAAIVRAHDLGPERNRRLFAYYAQQARQRGTGDRAVYLYDLSPATLNRPPKYLGTAGELAAGK